MWHSYKKNLWSWHLWVYPTFGKHPNVKRPPHSPPNCGGLALALSSLTNSAQSSQSRPGLIGWAAIRVAFKKKHIFVGTIGFGAYRFFPCCCPIFWQSQKKRVAIDPETAGESFCARPYLYFACGPVQKTEANQSLLQTMKLCPCLYRSSRISVHGIFCIAVKNHQLLRGIPDWIQPILSRWIPLRWLQCPIRRRIAHCSWWIGTWDHLADQAPGPGLLLTPATNPSICVFSDDLGRLVCLKVRPQIKPIVWSRGSSFSRESKYVILKLFFWGILPMYGGFLKGGYP